MNNKNVKIILHIDMNAFYASCAMIREPYLKNKVFAIGGPSGDTNKGVLSTASYKARALGINSGMSIADAVKLYPRLLIVPTDFKLYQEKSTQFINLLKEYSTLVEQASIDEAYLDITELAKVRHPIEITKEIQKRILEELSLPTSIGMAPTLFLAKMGSDYQKPNGLTVLGRRNVKEKLYRLSVRSIYGVGTKTATRLQQKGILTIAQFMDGQNEEVIKDVISEKHYHMIVSQLNGDSSNQVEPNRHAIPKSISHETTLNYPTDDFQTILDEMNQQIERTINRLNEHKLLAKTVGLKLKYTDFQTINRSTTFFEYSNNELEMRSAVESLLNDHYNNEPVRLVGVFATNLIQLDDYLQHRDLFNYHKRAETKKK